MFWTKRVFQLLVDSVSTQSHNPQDAAKARKAAADSAEARARLSKLMGSGKLGYGSESSSVWKRLSPRERAARAAERRAAEAARGFGDDELPDEPAGLRVAGEQTGAHASTTTPSRKRNFCGAFSGSCDCCENNERDNDSIAPRAASSRSDRVPTHAGATTSAVEEEERLFQLAVAASMSEESNRRQPPEEEEDLTLKAVLAASLAETRSSALQAAERDRKEALEEERTLQAALASSAAEAATPQLQYFVALPSTGNDGPINLDSDDEGEAVTHSSGVGIGEF